MAAVLIDSTTKTNNNNNSIKPCRAIYTSFLGRYALKAAKSDIWSTGSVFYW
jgi:hypothetical protein